MALSVNDDKVAEDEVSFKEFAQTWVGDVLEGDPSSIEKGERFARKLITQWLDLTEGDDDLIACDGSGDGGIDLAYLDRGDDEDGDPGLTGSTWYLVQSKYGTAFTGKDSLIRESQKIFATLSNEAAKLSSLSQSLVTRLRQFLKDSSEDDRLILVFATEEPLTPEEENALRDVVSAGRGRFGPIFDVEAISVRTIFDRRLTKQNAGLTVTLKANYLDVSNEVAFLSVRIEDLYDFLKTYKKATGDLDRIYEKNLRRFLTKSKLNPTIQKTLRDSPERFGIYNNGITIVAEEFKTNGGSVSLREPYIVNGCQTSRSIYHVLQGKVDSGATGQDETTKTWRTNLNKNALFCKLIRVNPPDAAMIRDITRAANSQNAITRADFIALEQSAADWARDCRKQYDLFLEIAKGEWDAQKALQKQDKRVHQFTRHEYVVDLLKVYAACWAGLPGTAWVQNAAFSPGGRIFTDLAADASFGASELYCAHRLRQLATEAGFGARRATTKASRRLTRYLFYFILGELLKRTMQSAGLETDATRISAAFLSLLDDQNKEALNTLNNVAVQTVDEYASEGSEFSMFQEPNFANDANKFLKSKDLSGATLDKTPKLQAALVTTAKAMRMGERPQANIIIEAIQK